MHVCIKMYTTILYDRELFSNSCTPFAIHSIQKRSSQFSLFLSKDENFIAKETGEDI